MKLIDNWRTELRRLWSPQLAAAAAIVEGANQIAAELAGVLPWRWVSIAAGILALLAAIARLIKQEVPDGSA